MERMERGFKFQLQARWKGVAFVFTGLLHFECLPVLACRLNEFARIVFLSSWDQPHTGMGQF